MAHLPGVNLYMTVNDQPAVGPDGQLLDASKIEWYHDPDDAHPIQSIGKAHDDQGSIALVIYIEIMLAKSGTLASVSGRRFRPVRLNTGAQLKEAIAEEKLDEYGNPTQLRAHRRQPKQPRNPCTSNSKRKRADEVVTGDAGDTDPDDDDFNSNTSSDTGSELVDEDASLEVVEISNEEVWTSTSIGSMVRFPALVVIDSFHTQQIAEMLPAKTIPDRSCGGQSRTLKQKNRTSTSSGIVHPKKKARSCSVEVERVPANNRSSNTIQRTTSISSTASSQKVGNANPISVP